MRMDYNFILLRYAVNYFRIDAPGPEDVQACVPERHFDVLARTMKI
jgi:hypothetical protein